MELTTLRYFATIVAEGHIARTRNRV